MRNLPRSICGVLIFLFVFLIFSDTLKCAHATEMNSDYDHLVRSDPAFRILHEPYGALLSDVSGSMFGSRRTHEEVISMFREAAALQRNSLQSQSDVQPKEFFDVTSTGANEYAPRIKHKIIGESRGRQHVNAHLYTLENPQNHFSIYPPLKGCGNRVKPTDTGRAHKCLVVSNASFFNTRTGACHGNIVSDSKIVQNHGKQNANFGITKDNKFMIGYVSDKDIQDTPQSDSNFQQLVAGVVWLVRNGESFVDASVKIEDMSVQETGSSFTTVIAPRMAIGHNRKGELMLMAVDGASWLGRGIDLYNFAEMLIERGFVNAINLDGGGSVTLVENGTLVNYPSDRCEDNETERCERAVTAIACIHNNEAASDNPFKPIEETHIIIEKWVVVTGAMVLMAMLLCSLCCVFVCFTLRGRDNGNNVADELAATTATNSVAALLTSAVSAAASVRNSQKGFRKLASQDEVGSESETELNSDEEFERELHSTGIESGAAIGTGIVVAAAETSAAAQQRPSDEASEISDIEDAPELVSPNAANVDALQPQPQQQQ